MKKAVAFGRWITEFPAEANLQWQCQYGRAKIHSERQTREQFYASVEQQRKINPDELIKITPLDYDRVQIEYGIVKDAVMLIHRRPAHAAKMWPEFMLFKALIWIQGFTFRIEPFEDTMSELPKIIHWFNHEYFARLRYRDPQHIPDEPGVCIPNGFILSDGSQPNIAENVSIHFYLDNMPKIYFYIGTKRHLGPVPNEPTLKQRLAKAGGGTEIEGWNEMTTPRSGDRQVGPWRGFELFKEYPGEQGGRDIRGLWEYPGLQTDPYHPRIAVSVILKGNRGPLPASLGQILAVFDMMVGGLKIRPNVNKNPAASAPVELPAELKPQQLTRKTMDPVPRAGAWEVVSPRPIIGSPYRDFLVGERFNRVLVRSADGTTNYVDAEFKFHEDLPETRIERRKRLLESYRLHPLKDDKNPPILMD